MTTRKSTPFLAGVCLAPDAGHRLQHGIVLRQRNESEEEMKFANRKFFGLGGLAAAALLVGMMAPKAAHAIVATAVQVVNTAANPVPNLDTERNARIPYESTSTVTCGLTLGPCQFDFTFPPPGYRLVIQNINGYIRETSATMPTIFFRANANNFLGIPSVANGSVALVNQNLVSYSEFTTPQAYVSDVTFNSTFSSQLTVIGYMENCAVTGCPAIQH
jgi:hypothetical protein